MTLIRKLASALFLALLCSSYSNSQTIDYTTGNLINYSSTPTATTSTWNNGVYVNSLQCWSWGDPGNCGPNPSVRPNGNINFSYGQVDLNQVININAALANNPAGVRVNGFNFGFMAKNGNGWDNGQQDYLAAYVKFYNAGGSEALNYDYSNQTNRKYNWTNFQFSETFTNPIVASTLSTAKVGFIGRDTNFWAGTYGPEIYNVAFSLKYSVDPCATNPAYSPNCAGFNTVLKSSNLVPNPDGYAYGGSSINNSYAINTALAAAGSGAMIHGFQWGYVANANGPYCASWFLVCWDNRDPSVTTNVNITSSTGASLYSVTREYRDSYNTTNYSYLFPSSQQMTSLGNFNFTASTNDQAYVGSMWSKSLYTVDPCVTNPLYSPTCPGYANATSGKTTYTAPSIISTTTTVSSDPTVSSPTTTNVGGAELSSTGTVSASTGVPQIVTDSQSAGSTSSSTPTTTTTTSVSSTGVATTTTTTSTASSTSASNSGGSKPNMSLIMSVIGNIQAADKATQAMAVQNAQQVVATSSAAAQAQANQVVEQLNTMSAASSQGSQLQPSSSSSSTQTQQSSGSVVSLQGPNVLSAQTLSAMAAQSSLTATQSQQQGSYQNSSTTSAYSLTSNTTGRTSFGLSFNNQSYNTTTMAMVTPQITQQVTQQRSESRANEQEVPVPLTLAAISRGNVLSDLINSRPDFGNNQQDMQQNTTVKKNVLPNELAGGVDVAAMAQIPKGYEAYSLVTLRDAPFYKPEAIYKDNKTVDNVRLLRGLTGGSDAKHQEMVNSQYKIGN